MIAQWQPGGAYLNDTIRRMHAAFDFCAAHGIVLRHRFLLWCQGESDGDHHTAPDVYAEQFCRMYETLRRENIEHCFLPISPMMPSETRSMRLPIIEVTLPWSAVPLKP